MSNLRVVTRRGSVRLGGIEFCSEALAPFAGTIVRAWVDPSIGEADAVCCTRNGEFICNAHNAERWVALVDDLSPESLSNARALEAAGVFVVLWNPRQPWRK
jgi:hypothetical protein